MFVCILQSEHTQLQPSNHRRSKCMWKKNWLLRIAQFSFSFPFSQYMCLGTATTMCGTKRMCLCLFVFVRLFFFIRRKQKGREEIRGNNQIKMHSTSFPQNDAWGVTKPTHPIMGYRVDGKFYTTNSDFRLWFFFSLHFGEVNWQSQIWNNRTPRVSKIHDKI